MENTEQVVPVVENHQEEPVQAVPVAAEEASELGEQAQPVEVGEL